MPNQIHITAGEVLVNAELNDTATATAVWNALPITASGNTWGDEIYFRVPVDTELEQGQEVVDLGDLGYWPPGQAFCSFSVPLPPAAATKSGRPAQLPSSARSRVPRSN